jgi:UDP-N-acetylglucosamine diphosphorylase / glucose-1-phosphate thymidylyltransferase / UDP-N-acetylgalactosamine diphosphorylase / glucosamine-1-phosphate N-acetyltransferase / galactosamine-1-phosphate N-acetyltransferase
MRKLHSILPMAGRGSRFAEVGFTTPKPLIPVDGQPMFKKALASLDEAGIEQRHTVILRKEHDIQYDLGSRILAELPGANIVITDERPTGALRDAYRARPHLRDDEGILIMDCDIAIKSEAFFSAIKANLVGSLAMDAAVMIFESDRPLYTYAQLDNDGRVLTTAEKKVISPHAIAGGHYISSLGVFDKAAQAVLARPLDEQHPEHYVSYMYNEIIGAGGLITSWPGEFTSFGTPQELAAYEAASQHSS